MSAQQIPLLIYPVKLTQDVPAKRFVNYSGALAGGTVSSAPVLGVTDFGGVIGNTVPTIVYGSAITESGGALSSGTLSTSFGVVPDSLGRAVAAGTNSPVAHLAPGQSASGAGEFVELILF